MAPAVGIVIDSLYGGGAEKSVLTLASALRDRGAAVHLFVLDARTDYAIPDGLAVHRVPEADRGLATVRKRARAMERAVAAVERAEGRPFSLFLSNLDRANEVVAATGIGPVRFVIRNSIEEQLRIERRRGPVKYLRMLRSKQALDGKHLITISRGLAREIEERGRIRPASVRVIYNAFDLERIRALAREPIDGVPGQPYVVHVGRCARQKRHDVLFEAFARVPKPTKLVLLTNNPDKARRIAARHGVDDRLVTPGFQQNPYAWMARARLLVLSSDHEGLGRVLVEALACGTPVVSTRCPHGPEEILGEGLRHWLVPVGRPDLLGDKIREALATDIDLAAWEMRDAFDAGRIAERYLELANEAGAADRR